MSEYEASIAGGTWQQATCSAHLFPSFNRPHPHCRLLRSLALPFLSHFRSLLVRRRPYSSPAMALAGRPPFATDEPDSFYESVPTPQRRIRQPAPPNAHTSAYNVYVSCALNCLTSRSSLPVMRTISIPTARIPALLRAVNLVLAS